MSLENQNTKPTLKELMKEHWAKRDFQVSPETANMVGVSLFLYSLFIASIFYFLWLLPATEASWAAVAWKSVVALAIGVQVFKNWRLCVRNHKDLVLCPHCKAQGLEIQKEKVLAARRGDLSYCDNWRYCTSCQAESPPRAHHCKLCKVCVLRRDHHCYFTARCVGFHTQRRFIVLCLYTAAGYLWLGSTFFSYLYSCSFASALNFFLPVAILRFLISDVTLKFLFVLLNLYLFALVGGLACFFFLWEWLLLLDGKTAYEAKHLSRRYDCGMMENVRRVFGNYFLIHFLWPFDTELPCDGFNWELGKKAS